MRTPEIIVGGKNNGEGMVIHYKTSSGTDIFGLGMPNNYDVGEELDLGPTWCYLILGKKTTLIDTGRFDTFGNFITMLKSTDKEVSDIDRVIVTHCHEDHDGNIADILSASGAELWAHEIYPQMITYHPDIIDGAPHPDLPGSCRLCVMPGAFCNDCAPYLKKRSRLNVDLTIKDGQTIPDEDISFIFTPGHTADSICTILENEIIFAGDTLLPDITPHPSRAYAFRCNRRILPEEYATENRVYGLMVYIKSLEKIASLVSQPFEATFPAHRLFHHGKFNLVHNSSNRAREIIQFHIDRCRDILRITDGKPTGLDYIVVNHFPNEFIEGAGKNLAIAEIVSHIEVMRAYGDIRWVGENKDTIQHTGSNNFLGVMEAYLH